MELDEPESTTTSLYKDTSIGELVEMTGFYRFDGVEFISGEKCKIVHGENEGTETHLMRVRDRVTLYVPDSKFEKVS